MNVRNAAPPETSQQERDGNAELRRRAEEQLATRLRKRLEKLESADVDWLVHELGVHQIELEAQNEHLLQAQAALEASRDRLAALYQQAPVAYVTTALDGRIVDVNELAVQLFGNARHQLVGRRLLEHFFGTDRHTYQRTTQKVLLEGGVATLELRLVRAHGTTRWVTVRLTLVKDEVASARQFRVALLDITERVRLQEERTRLASIVASSGDAIIARDLDGCVLSWNRGAEQLLSYTADQMIGATIDRILPAERLAGDAEARQRLRSGARITPYETELIHLSGTRVPVLLSISAMHNESHEMIGTSLIARDISERKRVERALHRRLRQLDLLSQAGQVLIMSEPGATPMQHELFDRVRLAVGGEVYMNYALAADPNTLQLVSEHGLSETLRAALATAPVTESLCGMAVTRRAPVIMENLQGSDLPQARLLQAEGLRAFACFPLVAHGEVHGVAAFGSTTRDRFRDGDLQVIQTVCDQVSAMLERDRLLAELHTREESLKIADRRKDDFIATLAHELRNPLAPIRNAIGILRRSSMPDPQLAWCRDVIERQITQMTHLLEDLLDVSRVTRNKIELRRERVELQQIIEDAIETTRPLVDAQRHELRVELPDEPVVVYGDMTRLTQVIGNLLNNAAKYTDVGGTIELTMRCEGDEALICVRDNGIGIEPQQVPLVFDMFAQLKPALERSRGGLGTGCRCRVAWSKCTAAASRHAAKDRDAAANSSCVCRSCTSRGLRTRLSMAKCRSRLRAAPDGACLSSTTTPTPRRRSPRC